MSKSHFTVRRLVLAGVIAGVLPAAGGKAEDHAEGQEKGQNFFHHCLLLFVGIVKDSIAFALFLDNIISS